MSSAASGRLEAATRSSLFSLMLTLRRFLTGRRAWLAVGAVLLLGLITVGRANMTAAAPGPAGLLAGPRPLPVVVAAAGAVDSYEVLRSYSGELRARRSADLGWESSGRVASFLVDEGDRVLAGELLATLESDRLSAELDGLRAQREGALAQLEELENGPRPQTIAVARARLTSLENQLELARQQHERRTQLVAGEFVTADELDATRTRIDTLGADTEAARQTLDELEEGARHEDIVQQAAVVVNLDATIARLEVDLADRSLRAPFDAIVSRRSLDEGAVVDPGRTALSVFEADALEARIGVPIERALELEVGAEVELELRGELVTARVRALVPELDGPTRTTDVVVELGPEDSRVHMPGEIARLVLPERIEESGTWVPTAALVRGARGLWAAYALVPDEREPGVDVIERRDLQVLHTTGERSLVRGTIQNGDRLVVEGVHRVVPGQRVVPAESGDERGPRP